MNLSHNFRRRILYLRYCNLIAISYLCLSFNLMNSFHCSRFSLSSLWVLFAVSSSSTTIFVDGKLGERTTKGLAEDNDLSHPTAHVAGHPNRNLEWEKGGEGRGGEEGGNFGSITLNVISGQYWPFNISKSAEFPLGGEGGLESV